MRLVWHIYVSALDYGPNALQLEEDISSELLLEMCKERYMSLPAADHTLQQTSVEWLEQRRDRVTASNFGKIVKRKVGCVFK